MPLADIMIVSGGQTDADRAALDFTITLSIPHGGWRPKGRKAEDGTIDPLYQLKETPSAHRTVTPCDLGANGQFPVGLTYCGGNPKRPWLQFKVEIFARTLLTGFEILAAPPINLVGFHPPRLFNR